MAQTTNWNPHAVVAPKHVKLQNGRGRRLPSKLLKDFLCPEAYCSSLHSSSPAEIANCKAAHLRPFAAIAMSRARDNVGNDNSCCSCPEISTSTKGASLVRLPAETLQRLSLGGTVPDPHVNQNTAHIGQLSGRYEAGRRSP